MGERKPALLAAAFCCVSVLRSTVVTPDDRLKQHAASLLLSMVPYLGRFGDELVLPLLQLHGLV
jgi:hypothetical protein